MAARFKSVQHKSCAGFVLPKAIHLNQRGLSSSIFLNTGPAKTISLPFVSPVAQAKMASTPSNLQQKLPYSGSPLQPFKNPMQLRRQAVNQSQIFSASTKNGKASIQTKMAGQSLTSLNNPMQQRQQAVNRSRIFTTPSQVKIGQPSIQAKMSESLSLSLNKPLQQRQQVVEQSRNLSTPKLNQGVRFPVQAKKSSLHFQQRYKHAPPSMRQQKHEEGSSPKKGLELTLFSGFGKTFTHKDLKSSVSKFKRNFNKKGGTKIEIEMEQISHKRDSISNSRPAHKSAPEHGSHGKASKGPSPKKRVEVTLVSGFGKTYTHKDLKNSISNLKRKFNKKGGAKIEIEMEQISHKRDSIPNSRPAHKSGPEHSSAGRGKNSKGPSPKKRVEVTLVSGFGRKFTFKDLKKAASKLKSKSTHASEKKAIKSKSASKTSMIKSKMSGIKTKIKNIRKKSSASTSAKSSKKSK